MEQVETLALPTMEALWQQTLGWQPDAVQQQQLQSLYEGIVAGNQTLNLTRITTPNDFWEKHLWDSLRGIKPLLQTEAVKQRVIDIGTGAGFPGIPVAIALPHCHLTLLDSTRKKIAFLDTLLTQLPLDNATTLIGRAETVGKEFQHRKSYDIALIRAVANASICAAYALPFLKPGGLAILYRGQWTEAETDALQPIVAKLGGVIESIEAFTTPLSDSVRHCLYLRQGENTAFNLPRPVI